MASLSAPIAPTANILGEPPAPTWSISLSEVLSKALLGFHHPSIHITGLTPALATTLNSSNYATTSALPATFVPKANGMSNLLGVRCELLGEVDTFLEGGSWNLEVYFPVEFPWGSQPTFHLVTPFFHSDVRSPAEDNEDNKENNENDGDDGDDGDDDGDSENEKAETSMLHARLVAAKKALAPPSVSLDSIKTTSLEHLSKPTLTVEIVGSDRSRHDIHVSNDDTSAGLKLRYASSTSWVSGQDEVLVRNGVELLDARELVQGDVLFIVRRRHHGRCGPLTSCEGRCSLCQKKSTFFSYGAETVQGSMRWLQGVVEYRQWMHRPVSEMREEMMVQAGRGQVEEEDGRRWTPWVGVWDAMKVKNMRAAVMLAEGRMDEYEKESRSYVQCYAKRGGSSGSGRLQKEPRAPPVPVVKATNLLLAPPPPPPPLATSMN